MSRPSPLAFFAFFTTLVVMPALQGPPAYAAAPADSPATAAPADPGDPRGVTSFEPTRVDAAPSVARRTRSLRATHERALAELRAELGSCAPEARPGLQRRVEGEKLAYESSLLALQLERARGAGRADDARRIEARLERLRPAMARLGVNVNGGAR